MRTDGTEGDGRMTMKGDLGSPMKTSPVTTGGMMLNRTHLLQGMFSPSRQLFFIILICIVVLVLPVDIY